MKRNSDGIRIDQEDCREKIRNGLVFRFRGPLAQAAENLIQYIPISPVGIIWMRGKRSA